MQISHPCDEASLTTEFSTMCVNEMVNRKMSCWLLLKLCCRRVLRNPILSFSQTSYPFHFAANDLLVRLEGELGKQSLITLGLFLPISEYLITHFENKNIQKYDRDSEVKFIHDIYNLPHQELGSGEIWCVLPVFLITFVRYLGCLNWGGHSKGVWL